MKNNFNTKINEDLTQVISESPPLPTKEFHQNQEPQFETQDGFFKQKMWDSSSIILQNNMAQLQESDFDAGLCTDQGAMKMRQRKNHQQMVRNMDLFPQISQVEHEISSSADLRSSQKFPGDNQNDIIQILPMHTPVLPVQRTSLPKINQSQKRISK